MNLNSLNKVMFIGFVTKDPMTRKAIEGGGKLTRFYLVTNELFKKGGKPRPEFHSIVCWGVLAEFAERNIKKGKRIYVEGKLRHYYYQCECGKKIKNSEVNADIITFLGGEKDQEKEEPKEKVQKKKMGVKIK